MARYPTLEPSARLSAAVAAPRQVDPAALREAQRQGQTISQQADRVVQFAAQSLGERARLEGRRAGATAPQETLERFSERVPTTIYDRNAYDAAVAASSSRIETDARTAINQAHFDWVESKGLPEELNARIGSIIDGYSEAIGQLDPLAAQRLGDSLQIAGNAAFLSYSGAYLKEQAKENEARQIRLQHEVQQTVERIGGEQMPDFLLSATLTSYRESQRALGRDPDDIERDVLKLEMLGNVARIRAEFAGAPDRNAYLADFRKAVSGDKTLAGRLTGDARKTLAAEMQAQITAGNASYRAATADLRADIRSHQNQLKDLIEPSPQVLSELATRARALGDPETNALLDELGRRVDLVATMRNMPPSAQQELATQLLRVGGTEATNELAGLAQQIAQSSQSQASADVVSYHNRVSRRSHIPLLTLDDMRNPDLLTQRFSAVVELAGTYGVNRNYFTQNEKAVVTRFISDPAVSPADKLDLFASFLKGGGQVGKEALAQVASDSGVYFVAADHYAMGNQALARDIVAGVTAKATGVSLVYAPGFDRNMSQKLTTSGGVNILSADRGFLQQATEAVLLSEAGTGEVTEKKYERAQQRVLGATYTGEKHVAGGIVEAEGKDPVTKQAFKVWLPPGMPVSAFEYLEDKRGKITFADLQQARRQAGLSDDLPQTAQGAAKESSLADTAFTATGVPNFAYLLAPDGMRYLDNYQVPLLELYIVLSNRLGQR